MEDAPYTVYRVEFRSTDSIFPYSTWSATYRVLNSCSVPFAHIENEAEKTLIENKDTDSTIVRIEVW